MRYINLLFLLFSCFGCETTVYTEPTNIKVNGESFSIYYIDSCEYLSKSVGGNSGLLTHKGDCSNPIHKCICK